MLKHSSMIFTTFWACIGALSMKFVCFALSYKFYVVILVCFQQNLSAMLVLFTFCTYIGVFSSKFICFDAFLYIFLTFLMKTHQCEHKKSKNVIQYAKRTYFEENAQM